MTGKEAIEKFGVPKQEWSHKGGSFNIQVVHHFNARAEDGMDGGHRWNVYAFIFPTHPLFAKFNLGSDDFWQEVCTNMPFHAGPSYLRRHFDVNGGVVCIQVGSDYNRLHDNEFTHYATAEGAMRVFMDAVDLLLHMELAIRTALNDVAGPDGDASPGPTHPTVSPGAQVNFDRGVK